MAPRSLRKYGARSVQLRRTEWAKPAAAPGLAAPHFPGAGSAHGDKRSLILPRSEADLQTATRTPLAWRRYPLPPSAPVVAAITMLMAYRFPCRLAWGRRRHPRGNNFTAISADRSASIGSTSVWRNLLAVLLAGCFLREHGAATSPLPAEESIADVR